MKQRLLALDVLRGLTIGGMILVNSPGTMELCLSPFITFFLEWFDDGGRHLSFVYVYDGNVHVYFSEEILLYFG